MSSGGISSAAVSRSAALKGGGPARLPEGRRGPDAKGRDLIMLAASYATRGADFVETDILRALEAGATKGEVVEALLAGSSEDASAQSFWGRMLDAGTSDAEMTEGPCDGGRGARRRRGLMCRGSVPEALRRQVRRLRRAAVLRRSETRLRPDHHGRKGGGCKW